MTPNLENLEKLMTDLTAAQKVITSLDMALAKKQNEWTIKEGEGSEFGPLKTDRFCAKMDLHFHEDRVELKEAECRALTIRGRMNVMTELLKSNPDKW